MLPVLALDAPMLFWPDACKREREREREGGGWPGRERRKKKSSMACAMLRRTCLRPPRQSCRQRGGRKETNKGRPQEKKEGRRRTKRRRRTRTGNRSPRVPKDGEKKNSLICINKSIQKRAPGTNGKRPNTKHGVRCPKPFAKRRRNKNRTPKNKAKKGRTFFSPFSGRKTGAFQSPNKTPNNPGLPCQSSLRKTLREKT